MYCPYVDLETLGTLSILLMKLLFPIIVVSILVATWSLISRKGDCYLNKYLEA